MKLLEAVAEDPYNPCRVVGGLLEDSAELGSAFVVVSHPNCGRAKFGEVDIGEVGGFEELEPKIELVWGDAAKLGASEVAIVDLMVLSFS